MRLIDKFLKAYGKDRFRNPESRIRKRNLETESENGIWKRNPETGSGTRQINEWFKSGSMIDKNTPPPFSLHSSQDGWWYTEPFKARYEYKERSRHHSFQFNKTHLLLFVGRHKGAYGKPRNPESGILVSGAGPVRRLVDDHCVLLWFKTSFSVLNLRISASHTLTKGNF